MASFFSDIFDAFTGQQATPQQTIIPTDQLLAQSYGNLNSRVAPGLISFNQQMAPALTDVQLGVANQIDPSILANFRGANRSILDQLNLGSALPEDLQQAVIQNALEGTAASGFGVSPGGRGLVARDLGLTSLDLLNRRQQAALGAGTSGLGVSRSFYDPLAFTQVGANLAGGITGMIDAEQSARDNLANVQEDIRRRNFSNLLNTGGKILGTVAGGIAGGMVGAPGLGAQMGGSIGGSLIQGSGVAGVQRQQAQQSSNPFSSILNVFGGGIGGPQYGIGAGQTYAGPGGNVLTSIRAAPVTNV